jgi:hypothetical protein
MLAKPRSRTEGFQMYKLAMLQRGLNSSDIILGKDADHRKGDYSPSHYEPISDTYRNHVLAQRQKFERAMKGVVTSLVSSQKELMPHTHAVNLLLKDTERSGITSALTRLERHLDNAIKQEGLPKLAFSLYTYRDEVISALKGDSRYAIRLKFAGTDAAERAAFEFVKRAIDQPDFQVEPTMMGDFGRSLKPFFESGDTLAEAISSYPDIETPYTQTHLAFPYTPGPNTVEHEIFMAESLKPSHDWELTEDNQRETQFFIQEHERDYASLYNKHALNEFSEDSQTVASENEMAFS